MYLYSSWNTTLYYSLFTILFSILFSISSMLLCYIVLKTSMSGLYSS